MKRLLPSFILVLALSTVFFACEEELGLEPLPPNPPQEVLPLLGSEIYLSANIGPQAIAIKNEQKGYGNGVDSAWYNYCSATSFDVLKGQSFYFNNFTDTSNINSIWFEFLKCSPDLETDPRFDSVIVPGVYDFGSVKDRDEGVVITWIDQNKKVWKSTQEDTLPDAQVNSVFTITDVVRNTDGFSAFIVAGTFEGILYDTSGNTINVSNGQYISRMGRDY